MRHICDELSRASQNGEMFGLKVDVPLKDRHSQHFGIMERITDDLLRRGEMLGLSPDGIQAAITSGLRHVARLHAHCESPIERDMATALVFANFRDSATFHAVSHIPKEDGRLPRAAVTIVPQFAFVKYRLDFAVIGQKGEQTKIFAVECDGADFHKDAHADRTRDLYLISFGIRVFRSSGSDINRDPVAVAEHIAFALAHWLAS